MSRIATVVAIVLLAACNSSSPKPDPELQKRNDALVKQHNDIWALMGLSQKAKDELNGIVVAVNSQVAKNKKEHPEMMAKIGEPKRTDHAKMTREDYLKAHKTRFDKLKISDATQKELMAGAEFCWAALYDKDAASRFNDEQRKVAKTIADMMKQLSGPPPCCDDNIFERAKG
jgi:hypothetical protein